MARSMIRLGLSLLVAALFVLRVDAHRAPFKEPRRQVRCTRLPFPTTGTGI